jgi:tRNA G18 (ribose-2'-O)-methylase SpoU
MVHGLHQGIVIDMYDFQYSSIDDLEGDFIVILDHIEDPH